MNNLKKEFNRFILILKFMTTIRVGGSDEIDPDFHKGIVYFPLAGFVVGLLTFIVVKIMQIIFVAVFSNMLMAGADIILPISILCSIAGVMFEAYITGGLHIDGLGDTFDAVFSNRSKERILEIMKDSRVGTNSLLAVLFTVLMKIALFTLCISVGIEYLIILMPVFGRLSATFLSYNTVTPREHGMGNMFIGKGSMKINAVSCIYSVIIASVTSFFLCFNRIGVVYKSAIGSIVIAAAGVLTVLIATKKLKSSVYRKIDGITGDVLGCSIELNEVFFMLISIIVTGIIIRFV